MRNIYGIFFFFQISFNCAGHTPIRGSVVSVTEEQHAFKQLFNWFNVKLPYPITFSVWIWLLCPLLKFGRPRYLSIFAAECYYFNFIFNFNFQLQQNCPVVWQRHVHSKLRCFPPTFNNVHSCSLNFSERKLVSTLLHSKHFASNVLHELNRGFECNICICNVTVSIMSKRKSGVHVFPA